MLNPEERLFLLKSSLTNFSSIVSCLLAASFAFKPSDVALPKNELAGSDILTTTVIGFPHGSNLTEVMVFEAAEKALIFIEYLIKMGS